MLSEQQVRDFRELGFTVQPSFLSASEVKAILADFEQICEGATLSNHDASRLEMEPKQGPEGALVRRVYEPCTYYPRFRTLSESNQLLDCVEQLLGPNLSFHYSKLNVKPQSIGSVVEWHQDLAYYPLTNPDSLAVLLYLDDATPSNGCLQIIPRRHTGPIMDHTGGGYFRGKITEPVDPSSVVYVDGKAGSAIFMHGKTPHASAPNTSPEPRRTLILSYRAADAFPIYLGAQTDEFERHVRHVRGKEQNSARLAEGKLAIPRFQSKIKSLFELQEQSRNQKGGSGLRVN
jgi:ectoine hydroxylase-related dioxygenase (phytanoyl-CoA dioxygenase family)